MTTKGTEKFNSKGEIIQMKRGGDKLVISEIKFSDSAINSRFIDSPKHNSIILINY